MSQSDGNQCITSSVPDSAPPPARLDAVSVKPSPFWRANPELWFVSLEAQFVRANIVGDATKYFTVVAALDESVIKVVSDLVLNPPAEDKYLRLKENLISRLSGSQNRQLKQLLNDLVLGDLLPSQLLREMKTLNKDNRLAEDILKSLWLQRLPPHMQAILSCNPGSLDDLACCADKIAEVNTRPELYSVASTQQPTENNPNFHSLETSLTKLSKNISALRNLIETGTRPRNNQRSSSVSRHRSSSRDSPKNQQRCCWYHTRYGAKALKCTQPCTFGKTTSAINSTNLPSTPN